MIGKSFSALADALNMTLSVDVLSGEVIGEVDCPLVYPTGDESGLITSVVSSFIDGETLGTILLATVSGDVLLCATYNLDNERSVSMYVLDASFLGELEGLIDFELDIVESLEDVIGILQGSELAKFDWVDNHWVRDREGNDIVISVDSSTGAGTGISTVSADCVSEDREGITGRKPTIQ